MPGSTSTNFSNRVVDARLKPFDAQRATDLLEDAVREIGNARGKLKFVMPQDGAAAPAFARRGWFTSRQNSIETTERVKDLFAQATSGLSDARRAHVARSLDLYLSGHRNGVTRSLAHVVVALKSAQGQQAAENARLAARVASRPAPAKRASATQSEALSRAAKQWGPDNPAFRSAVDNALKGRPGIPAPLSPVLKDAVVARVAQELQPTLTTWARQFAATAPTALDLQRLGAAVQGEIARVAQDISSRCAPVDDALAGGVPPDSPLIRLSDEVKAWLVLDQPDADVSSRVIDILANRRATTLDRALRQAAADEMTDAWTAREQLPAGDRDGRARAQARFEDAAVRLATGRYTAAMKTEWLDRAAAQARCDAQTASAIRVRAGLIGVAVEAEQRQLSPVAEQAQSVLERGTALLLARELLTSQGSIDTARIPALRQALTEGGRLDGPGRERVLQTLDRLADPASGLAAAIESIGAPAPSNTVGADMVRVTLGLENASPVTAVAARTAALSALLAPLRQGSVGSCFATSQAIRLHDARPLEMLADLKQLLEQGRLTFRLPTPAGGERTVEVPLSRFAGTRALESAVRFGRLEARALTRDPGMAAGLHAMGVSHLDMPDVVAGALTRLQARAGAPDKTTMRQILEEVAAERHGVTAEQRAVIGKLPALRDAVYRANMTGGDADAAVDAYDQAASALDGKLAALAAFQADVAAAVSGFQGATDNRLLRAWEYTLSAAIEGEQGGLLDAELRKTIKSSVAGRLAGVTLPAAERGGLGQTAVQALRQSLTERLTQRVGERLAYLYDASMLTPKSADGRSSAGGFVLYDKSGQTDPQQWKRVETAGDFRLVLEGLLTETAADLAAEQGDAAAAGVALRGLAREAARTLWNNNGSKLFSETANETLWRVPRGYSAGYLLAARSGRTKAALEPTRLHPEPPRRMDMFGFPIIPAQTPQAKPAEIGAFVIRGLRKMQVQSESLAAAAPPGGGTATPTLQAAVARDPADFGVLVGTSNHAFLVKPGLRGDGNDPSLLDAWQDTTTTPEAWFEANVTTPGQAAGREPLTSQAAATAVDVFRRGLDADSKLVLRLNLPASGDADYATWRDGIVASAGAEPSLAALYSALRADLKARLTSADVRRDALQGLQGRVRDTLAAEIDQALDADLEKLSRHLSDVAVVYRPPPKLVFADTNWGTGREPIHFALLRNPVNDQDELWQVSSPRGGELQQRVDGERWYQNWSLYDDASLYL